MYTQAEKLNKDRLKSVAQRVGSKRDKQKQNNYLADNRNSTTNQLITQQMAESATQHSGIAAQLASNAVYQLGKKGKRKAAIERNAKKKSKSQSQSDRSYNNLCAYRAGWVKRNNITAANVAEFKKTYRSGIRGHASGDNSKGEQGNTTQDCNAYKSWHTKKYGVWH